MQDTWNNPTDRLETAKAFYSAFNSTTPIGEADAAFEALPGRTKDHWVKMSQWFLNNELKKRLQLDEKEQELLQSSIFVAENMPNTPLPGRNLINLVAKLAFMLDIQYDGRYTPDSE